MSMFTRFRSSPPRSRTALRALAAPGDEFAPAIFPDNTPADTLFVLVAIPLSSGERARRA